MPGLTLSRYPGERIIITLPSGQLVTVEVVGITDRSGAQLGITAPEDVPIRRQEIADRPRDGNGRKG